MIEEVTQSHFWIDGTFQDRVSKASAAFRAWCREQKDNDFYSWNTSILGIDENEIYFYCSDWDTEPTYYSIAYSNSSDSGAVTITGEAEKIDVKLVVERLQITEPSTQAEEQTMKKVEEVVQTDTVADESVIADAAASATSAQIGTTPKANPKKTEAETGGSSVEDVSDDAKGAKGVDHSDGEGASEEGADNSTEAAVKTELGKTEAGYKGQSLDPTKAVQGVAYDSAGQPMAYIQSVEKTETDGKTQMKIQGIATKGDIVNKVGQVYPLSVWTKNLEQMNAQAATGKFLGKLEHPEVEQGLVDTAIKFNNFWIQGSELWFDAVVVPTEPHGKNLQALLEAGVQIDMSSRGYGTFAMQDWRGTQRPVMQDDFICTAIDAVWHGASTGSGVTEISYQSDPNPTAGKTEGDTTVETQAVKSAEERAAEIRAKAELTSTRNALLQDAGLSEVGMKAYRVALEKCTDIQSLMTTHDNLLENLQSVFPSTGETQEVATQAATYTPTFFSTQSAEEKAPQNVGELFDRMCADLPDHYEGQSAGSNPHIPNHFRSPRAACKRLMTNVARERRGNFNGQSAALGLLALEQGKINTAQDILTQSLPTGATVAGANADGDGAPLSNYLLFPLIRRVFPMYIMNEIAAIQPMDRPEGKIFFLDQYRVDAGAAETRIDLNTSANPFNSSFGDNAVEGAAALQIRLRLASVLVQAHTKKLGAAWSIEEMQDLRAYHGLDAAQELLGGIAREMALEWNKEVLDDMVQQATGAALTYGKLKPDAGFTEQKDWDDYLWVYIQALDNAIFAKRNGPITHLIAGVDAALAMAKSMRGTFTIGGSNDNPTEMELYPGTTFYGTVNTPNGSRYRVLKTNFWGSGTANGSKIMGIRKGNEWSDTPYIWAPYTDYVTPMLTDPSDFSQKQGIVSRAAKKVVVSDAIGYITVGSGQGVTL